MKPAITIEGAAIVLRDVYTATTEVLVGDAVKVSGLLRAAGTEAPTDDVMGLAFNSARPNQPLAVVIAGIWRTTVAEAVQRGDVLSPADAGQAGIRGRARKALSLPAALSGNARRHAVALEDQPTPGRAVQVHVRTIGG